MWGTPALRDAITGWLERGSARARHPPTVLPVVGSKELVAWLPTQLGLGPGDRVAYPRLAYPTYEVGARLCGAEPVVYDDPCGAGPRGPKLLWLNSPSNPTGRVLTRTSCAASSPGPASTASCSSRDECYLELGWETDPVSVLHPDVCGGSLRGHHRRPLALEALQPGRLPRRVPRRRRRRPRRAAADPQARRDDDGRARPGGHGRRPRRRRPRDEQRERYAARRTALRTRWTAHGFRIEHSEASLYLWATRDEPCWDTVATSPSCGILVAPGDFYGEAGERFVRVALTATDERVRGGRRASGLRRRARKPPRARCRGARGVCVPGPPSSAGCSPADRQAVHGRGRSPAGRAAGRQRSRRHAAAGRLVLPARLRGGADGLPDGARARRPRPSAPRGSAALRRRRRSCPRPGRPS